MPYICPLCWFSFDTEAELNQHAEMEQSVEWTLGDYEPSTYAETM